MLISVAYVHTDGRSFYQSLDLPDGASVRSALDACGWLALPEFAEFNAWLMGVGADELPNHKAWFVGVFSQKKPLNHSLQNGDRVEIYRPLTADAMNNRQSKVKIAKKQTAKAIQARNIARLAKKNSE